MDTPIVITFLCDGDVNTRHGFKDVEEWTIEVIQELYRQSQIDRIGGLRKWNIPQAI